MKPFCGYNFADYWAHWVALPEFEEHLPPIFHVNWFRKDEAGKFMWPGFGENMRILEWIIKRCKGEASVHNTPIGGRPYVSDINIDGLKTDRATLRELLEVDTEAWSEEMEQIREYLLSYGDRLPPELMVELDKVVAALKESS